MTDAITHLTSAGLDEAAEVRTYQGYYDEYPMTVEIHDTGTPGRNRFHVVVYPTGKDPHDLNTPRYVGNPEDSLEMAISLIRWNQAKPHDD